MNNASLFSHVRRILMLALLAFSFGALAEKPVNTLTNSFFAKQTDTAINGYDSVAYFTQNAPVKGLDAHTFDHKGAKWKFSSAANLELFKANPEKYAPQYGGYCAYGVANDSLVKVDPNQFSVVDGKLYLNYDASIQKDWLKDRAGLIKKADAKFLALIAK
ncbi:MAG: YHS domain-containing (seleno)protein [Polaromonas sp.]